MVEMGGGGGEGPLDEDLIFILTTQGLTQLRFMSSLQNGARIYDTHHVQVTVLVCLEGSSGLAGFQTSHVGQTLAKYKRGHQITSYASVLRDLECEKCELFLEVRSMPSFILSNIKSQATN
jgi:hypothetical protein